MPGLVALEKTSRDATTAHAIFPCLASWDTLARPDLKRAPWPNDSDPGARLNRIEVRLLNSLIKAPELDVLDLARAVERVRCDDSLGLRRGGSHDQRLAALLFRVSTELQEMGQPAVVEVGADAELIRACSEIEGARAAYDRDGGHVDQDDDPLWLAYERRRDAIGDTQAMSIAGLVAKARAAISEATMTVKGVTTVTPEDTPAAGWSWDIVNDLLRLFGGASSHAPRPCPAAALIPDIIAAAHEDDLMDGHVIGRDRLLDEIAKHHNARSGARLDALWALVETVRPTSAAGAQLCLMAAIRHVDDMEGGGHDEKEAGRKAEAALQLMAGAYYVLDKQYGSAGLDRVREHYLRISRYSLATDEEFCADRRLIHELFGSGRPGARAGA